MEYKDTEEYAFDVLEHEYNRVKDLINKIGKDSFNVYIPAKLITNLEVRTPKGDITTPAKYRGMEIIFAPVEKPLFVLKERQSCD